MDNVQHIDLLFENQLRDWELASVNYHDLNKIRVKVFSFENFEISLQFNPKRMLSSAAKVDARSIEARPCFLCSHNRPVQQQGIIFRDDYIILVNPFPIFPKHLTVPSLVHRDQRIRENFADMLHLSRALPGYVVFYNGPLCGASAPDHFHFQAGLKGLMPLERDFSDPGRCIFLEKRDGIKLYRWQQYLRNLLTMQGKDLPALTGFFNKLYAQLQALQTGSGEPMMNILAWFENDEWVVHVFPRKMHRPSQYFEEGSRKIVISPASVDLGGAFIVPRQEDFEKIGSGDIADILRQVCLDDTGFMELMKGILN
jgi:ATP adenylyltransferase/5',5'''-P-1,P-4-tetraphosphate phosphorylase II